MSGIFVAVVGPSGAGKDSLIAGARHAFAGDERVEFVRRVITRAEGGNEDHDRLDAAVFPKAVAAGAFVLHWGAHGLYYGIPVTAKSAVAEGKVVVANLSRRSLDKARAVFPRVSVVNVTAPPDVLARRLAGRGRESEAEIMERLLGADADVAGDDVLRIDNGGVLEEAVDRFTAHLAALRQ